ncbi:hypothetical protein [Robiginitalea sp. SC105]|uniref:hypothetical protein n=1 Tax=Robiginitalea sp. SC105 TaxID=2762332 RepID=UPI00163AD177|nr:hypothetical protein [Robiginitalea sp. SC105]MBC2838634.1 hypothetical protein [Robiginitalea sp. SC105]
MKKFWKDPQNIIALGVTLISVCALVVSIAQTRVMNRQSELMDIQARASVRPILQMGTNWAFDPESGELIVFQIHVNNGGVGPATIDDVQVSLDGKPVRDWEELFSAFNIPDSIPTYKDNRRLSKSIIMAGEEVVILDLSENIELARLIYRKMNAVRYKITYSSIYGDSFELSLDENGMTNHKVSEGNESFGPDGFTD